MDDVTTTTAPSTTAPSAAQPDSPAAAQSNVSQGSAGNSAVNVAAPAAPNPQPAGATDTTAGKGTAGDAGQQPDPKEGTEGTQATAPVADITITLPDGVAVNAPMLQSYTDFAKKSGLSQQQAQAAAEWFMQENAAQQEAYKKSGEEYLRQAWGPDFATNMETSRKAIAEFDKMFGMRISTQLVNTGLADAPVVAELFHFLGEAISEEAMAAGNPSPSQQAPQSLLEHVQNTINKSVNT